MKYTNSLIAMLAIVFALGTAPATAQTTEELTPTPTEEGGEAESDENFSRKIPEGLKEGLTEEEITEYQARLDGAETPQERNEVRREIQRMSVERRHEEIKVRQEEKQGFFSGLMKKLGEGAKKRKESDAKAAKERKEKGLSKGGGFGGGSSMGGGKSGGKGGGRGNGGGKNK